MKISITCENCCPPPQAIFPRKDKKQLWITKCIDRSISSSPSDLHSHQEAVLLTVLCTLGIEPDLTSCAILLVTPRQAQHAQPTFRCSQFPLIVLLWPVGTRKGERGGSHAVEELPLFWIWSCLGSWPGKPSHHQKILANKHAGRGLPGGGGCICAFEHVTCFFEY